MIKGRALLIRIPDSKTFYNIVNVYGPALGCRDGKGLLKGLREKVKNLENLIMLEDGNNLTGRIRV